MPRFVVHLHEARRLHWDLRLELDGVLKSWAVPKGPPLEEKVKRLAVEVEDHPIGYIDFEGVIPPGAYGAGKVEIWDKGSYTLIERGEDHLKMLLEGKLVRGVYLLFRTKDRRWMLLKTSSLPET
ncbi:MAG: DNA polymerase ligase N-terminal domain-containing protein [Candidatus Bathyarchaeia archaeon]